MDKSFDAVIVGGGNKGLVLAMYLAKYGKMEVAVFERLHEVGGAWAQSEAAAPGFAGQLHAGAHTDWHHDVLYRDFPDFEEKVGPLGHARSGAAMAFGDESCLVLYHRDYDPSQELTAREIARFSERDAEKWLSLWDQYGKIIRPALVEWVYGPLPPPGVPDALEKLVLNPKAGIDPRWATMPATQMLDEMWESAELKCLIQRRVLSIMGTNPDDPGTGLLTYIFSMRLGTGTYHVAGGSHNLAHAAHSIILENGGKIFTGSDVEKVIIENDRAKGIRLADGTEIGARQLVVSTLSPQQLCFQLIGEEKISPSMARKIRALTCDALNITLYQWALRELPNYKAAKFNPDLNFAHGVHFAEDKDTTALTVETAMRRQVKKLVPRPSVNVAGTNVEDRTRSPEGMYTTTTETFVLPADALSESEWMRFKREHAEYKMQVFERFTTNISWDTVIGYAPFTPYDHCHLANMAPTGCISVIDNVPHQMGRWRPIPELAGHRTPIKNLYATGAAWPPFGGAMSCQGYNCYKVIADDYALSKPWKEKGYPY